MSEWEGEGGGAGYSVGDKCRREATSLRLATRAWRGTGRMDKMGRMDKVGRRGARPTHLLLHQEAPVPNVPEEQVVLHFLAAPFATPNAVHHVPG